jgi:Zn-dependent M28 family amino/carboxypeptidase
MRMMTLAAFAASLALAAPAAVAQDLAANAAAIRDKALVDQTAWQVAESLTTEIGPRLVGSPNMARAKDWAVAKFAELGFKNVKVESFTAAGWFRGEESAEVIGPYPHKLAVLGVGRSASTPKGGITAEAIVFRTYAEMIAQPEGALKGRIAVVTQAMPRNQDGSGYGPVGVQRRTGAQEAAKRGAVGYLLRSLSTDDTRLPHTGGASGPTGIPAGAISTPDAELLERIAARGKPITIKLVLESRFEPKVEAWNISGEMAGTEKPDEVIVIGGHLDSWDPGTGAVDDAAGIAITTAAAKLAAAKPLKRTIRVVMWGSEEQGGSSDAYLAAHKDEVPKMVVAGESDTGAGRIYAAELPGVGRDHAAMKAFRNVAAPLGVVFRQEVPTNGGADITGIVNAGAPVVSFSQDASRYFDLHHSADDTLDKIDPKELAQNVAVWAAFLYTVADSDVSFRK